MIELLAAVIAACAIASVLLTALVRRYAQRAGVFDHPNARSSHSRPTPRGGGLAVVAATSLGIAASVAIHVVAPSDAFVLCGGMLAIAAIGWMDDRRGVAPRVRLTVHIVVAAATLAAYRGLPSISTGVAAVHLGIGGYAIGIVGLVWSINLFNFMDGIDGIAGSQGVLIFGTAAALLFARGDTSLGTISALIAAATLGFLVWNWPPARIFMGDVGSGALGYAIAALAIASEDRGAVPILAIVILYGVFVADATTTLVRRVRRGERAAEAHRDHAYQRLTRVWKSHARVTITAGAITGILAVIAAVATVWPSLLLPSTAVAALLLAGLSLATERLVPM